MIKCEALKILSRSFSHTLPRQGKVNGHYLSRTCTQ